MLPDVTGLDKCFDYLVPPVLSGMVHVGSVVRCGLHGRKVRGWVVEIDPQDSPDDRELRPLIEIVGRGPDPEVVALTQWVAHRWAGRRRAVLVSASPKRIVRELPRPQRTGRIIEPRSPATVAMIEAAAAGTGPAVGLLRLAPTEDLFPVCAATAGEGPALIVTPSVEMAHLLAARLRRSQLAVAVMPDDWSMAAAGVDVVIGARATALAPCPGMRVAVLIDEHDEVHQSEATPTWHAREVLARRCAQAGAFFMMVSPVPSLEACEMATPTHPRAERERAGWPEVELVDRSDDVPWRRSLLSSALIEHLRTPGCRVVCVINTIGRARLLACRQCRELVRCSTCDAAMALEDHNALVCGRCGETRPGLCASCGSTALANLRPGVTRLREELQAAAGRPVAAITGERTARTAFDPTAEDLTAEIWVGTEAVLHRVPAADVVAFLDLDRELLAPRFRATEQLLSMMVHAARLLGPRRVGGRLLLQTFLPDHPVIDALRHGLPSRLGAELRAQRALLGLPPFGALALVEGAGAEQFAPAVGDAGGVQVGRHNEGFLVRAPDHEQLITALNGVERPATSRLRVVVDPPRV